VFIVEHHVRGKWACRKCETLVQAPVPYALHMSIAAGRRLLMILP